jgi:para-aminobenzoate synthetase component 1
MSDFRKPVCFQGNKRSNWLNIFASNPIDTTSLTLEDPPKKLINFVKKYDGKFLAGFITYEYGAKQLNAPIQKLKDGFPAAHFRAYNSYEEFEIGSALYSEWKLFTPVITMETYKKQFKKIKSWIKGGEFYQVNYTHILKSETKLKPKELFQSFRRKNQTGYSALFEDKNWAIHCLSPEQFIKIKNNTIVTRPIKGTIGRGNTPKEDRRNLNKLIKSEKEQAELYMIIDLLRNDLGKVCEVGSVQVLESKAIEALEKVYHTYGVVKGKLRNNISPIEALISMSPGGSVTGCPKKRACEAIFELEDHPRGVYTGTIGYILPDGTLNFNIAIRTIVQRGKHLALGVGGGITIGSKNDDEFRETLAKASSFQP